MALTDPIANRAKDTAAIKAPITNLAIGGTVTGLVASILTVWDDSFEKFFGYPPDQNPGVARAVVVAIIAAVTLLWVADLLARAIGSLHREVPAAAAPIGWTADIIKPGVDDTGYFVAAMRVTDSGGDFLLVKQGVAPVWKALADVTLHTT
jgi:hypothetical protein